MALSFPKFPMDPLSSILDNLQDTFKIYSRLNNKMTVNTPSAAKKHHKRSSILLLYVYTTLWCLVLRLTNNL